MNALLAAAYAKLCNQTITVYNRRESGGASTYKRTTIAGASMDFKRQWQEGKTGPSASTSCLLVIPQDADGKTFVLPAAYSGAEGTYTLAKDDKVLLGEGPEIATSAQWAAFIPSKVDGLVSIASVDPKYFNGELVHVEAGG